MSWDLIFQHLFIVLAASLLSIAVGLPLGIWAYVSKTARPVILRIVDLLQTIPSLALLDIELEFQLPIGRSNGQLPATCPYFGINVVFRT